MYSYRYNIFTVKIEVNRQNQKEPLRIVFFAFLSAPRGGPSPSPTSPTRLGPDLSRLLLVQVDKTSKTVRYKKRVGCSLLLSLVLIVGTARSRRQCNFPMTLAGTGIRRQQQLYSFAETWCTGIDLALAKSIRFDNRYVLVPIVVINQDLDKHMNT